MTAWTCPRNSVGLVERGKHALGLLALLRLADALGVNASELLTVFDKPHEESKPIIPK